MEAAGAGGGRPDAPGKWVKVERRFRDGRIEEWWALEVELFLTAPREPSEPSWPLPTPKAAERKTWYLVTNLPILLLRALGGGRSGRGRACGGGAPLRA